MNADEFRTIRKTAGLTQTALAEQIGKTRDMIARYERNAPIPPLVEFYMNTLKKGQHNE